MRWLFLLGAACAGGPDPDGDGFSTPADCDDADPNVHPAAVERCDDLGVDEDCDGLADAADPDAPSFVVYADADDDGFGAGAATTRCVVARGWSIAAGDCDDAAAHVHPGAVEVCDPYDVDESCDGRADDADPGVDPRTMTAGWTDADGDGSGDWGAPLSVCDPPESGWAANGDDCDDTEIAVHPFAAERCNGVDDDCDEATDEDPIDGSTFYVDQDGDTFGDLALPLNACAAPAGAAANGSDCDDDAPDVHPTADERCDGGDRDEDCDGLADDHDANTDAATKDTFWIDGDADGWGHRETALAACDAPLGYAANDADCDDANAAIHPAASEVCDAANVDEDCDAVADDADPSIDPASYPAWFADADLDGWGDAPAATASCEAGPGRVAAGGDCADDDPAVNPAAVERCDLADVDEDCDALADNDDPSASAPTKTGFSEDLDGDGDGATLGPLLFACDPPAGRGPPIDCDDSDAEVYPAAPERCLDAVDHDCDGVIRCALTQADAATLLPPGAEGASTTSWVDDIDGDGLSEIASGLVGSTSFSVFTTEGVELVEITGLGTSGWPISVPDHDGDGAPEIILPQAGSIYLLPSGSRGTVDATTELPAYLGLTNAIGATIDAVGDLDGDGVGELWTSSAPGAYLLDDDWVGAPSVVDVGVYVDRMPPFYPISRTCSLGDTDGDGKTDLMGMDIGNNFWVWTSRPVDGTDAGAADLNWFRNVFNSSLGADCTGGDLNGDGYSDAAFTGQVDDGSDAWVVYGPLPVTLVPDLQILGNTPYYAPNTATEAITTGDVTGDGLAEIALGLPVDELNDQGIVVMFSGENSGTVYTAAADLTITGSVNDQQFGAEVNLRGDMDGDGLADLLVGTTHPRTNELVYLYPATTLVLP